MDTPAAAPTPIAILILTLTDVPILVVPPVSVCFDASGFSLRFLMDEICVEVLLKLFSSHVDDTLLNLLVLFNKSGKKVVCFLRSVFRSDANETSIILVSVVSLTVLDLGFAEIR